MNEMDNNRKTKVRFRYFNDFHDAAFRILLIDDKVGYKDDFKKDPQGEEYKCKGIIKKYENKEWDFCKDCKKKKDEKTDCDRVYCDKEFFDITEIGTTGLQIIRCDDKKDCHDKQCKLCTIKRLMDDSEKDDGKSKVFDGIGKTFDYFYWQESGIECYYCPTVIKDFIEDNDKLGDYDGIRFFQKESGEKEKIEEEENKEQKKYIKIECDFAPKIKNRKDTKVQIVGVRDVRTALLLMSKYKFDMVFCDYLLDDKDGNNREREYAKQLLSFLSYDYEGEIKPYRREITKELDKAKKEVLEKDKKRLDTLNQLRHDVLDNRGPLDKLWIMPITGFNQTFIQDLYRNHVDLISSKWNISNGADPITTPWQFLYHLNKFVELQLKQCVYRMDHLLRFLLYTWEDLDAKLKENDGHGDFYAFQAFMGSEYANFMRRYGNRHIIQRDAYRDDKDVTDDKSVFATYIWNRFYADSKNRDVIELNRLIHKFFHQAATMHNDRNGQQRLEETFGQLCFFIDTNQKVRDAIAEEEDLKGCKLDNALKGLREKMDKLTPNRHDDENNK